MSKQDDSAICYNIVKYLDDARQQMVDDRNHELAYYYNQGYMFYRDLYYPSRLN